MGFGFSEAQIGLGFGLLALGLGAMGEVSNWARWVKWACLVKAQVNFDF